jgi:hypothetical protein
MIRTAFDRGEEFAAALEHRRLFPGIRDNDQARDCALAIQRAVVVGVFGPIGNTRFGRRGSRRTCPTVMC